MWDVTCPACGGLVEAANLVRLVDDAQQHTLVAHGYRVPAGHVEERASAGSEE